ncbi:MAG: tetratricopeptide repeat protein, partial [Acidobacteriota bacterium]
MIFALSALGAAPGASAHEAASAPVVPVPTPGLAGVSAEARAQVEAARRDLEVSRAGGESLSDAFGVLGARYLHVGALEAAATALENAVNLGPGAFRWRYYLAVTHGRRGHLEAAAAELRRALEIRGGNVAATLRLADIAFRLGAVDEARGLYEKALGSTLGGPAARAGLARLEGEPGEGEVAYPDPLMRQLALELGEPTVASAAAPPPDSSGALADLEEAAARLDPEGAAAHFRRLADSSSASPGVRAAAFFHLGRLRQADRRIDEAAALYRRALEVDPDQADALFSLGVILASNDRHPDAIELYRRLFERRPDAPDLRLRLAVSLMRTGQDWPALGHFEALLRAEPNHVEALIQSAVLLERVGEGGPVLAGAHQA